MDLPQKIYILFDATENEIIESYSMSELAIADGKKYFKNCTDWCVLEKISEDPNPEYCHIAKIYECKNKNIENK